jgi:hypothetical protein
MRGLIIFAASVAAAAGAWAYVDRSWAVAAPAAGGPFVRPAVDCAPPRPGADAALVIAGFYEGAGTSTIRLAATRPQEDGTSVVDIRIAPGTGAIYLVVVGETKTVIRFSGWTRRLERVLILTDATSPTGVTGLPLARVSFADRHACGLSAGQIYEPERGQRPSGLVRLLGRARPDGIGGAYAPYLLTVSGSGVGASVYDGRERAAGLEEWEGRFSPAGVLEVDAGQLIANVPAAPYRLLPAQAGLAQLVREGKLVRRGSDTFRVLAPIEAPVGLYGAQAVTFELAPGVPRPSGDIGHSRVVAQGYR